LTVALYAPDEMYCLGCFAIFRLISSALRLVITDSITLSATRTVM
jgi:hypothetical protein